MAHFKFAVSGQILDLLTPTKGISDDLNANSAEFDFRSSDWDNAEKWAHFSNPDYNDGGDIAFLLVDDEISAERGLNLPAGIWEIYLHGDVVMNGETVQRLVTENQSIQIVQSGIEDPTELVNVTPTEGEQILAKAAAAYNARITTATAELDEDDTGLPSVGVEISGENGAKNIGFTFYNLDGVGIESVTFETTGADKGLLTITTSDGTSTSFSGIKTAIAAVEEATSTANDAELVREGHETTRVDNETTREGNELVRQKSELGDDLDGTGGRVKAENDRVSAEEDRVEAEAGRVEAEAARVEEFDGIKEQAEGLFYPSVKIQNVDEAVFYTTTASSLLSFSAEVAVRQEGSGDPSSQNIRPFIGVDSFSIEQYRENEVYPSQTYEGLWNPLTLGLLYGGIIFWDPSDNVITVYKTHEYIYSYSGQTLPDNWKSDRDVYAEGTTPSTGAQVVYPLVTPIVFNTFTGIGSFSAFAGLNRFVADTGNILELTYIADLEANEVFRIAHENTRVANEASRVSAETERVNAESARVLAEGGRVTSESARVLAEDGRVTAEDNRVLAETARANEFARWSSQIAKIGVDQKVTLAHNNWAVDGDYYSQTVTVSGAKDTIVDQRVDVTPDVSSSLDYLSKSPVVTARSAGQLKFSVSGSAPSMDIVVYIRIVDIT